MATTLIVGNVVSLKMPRVRSVVKARETVTLTQVVLVILCVGKITAENIIVVQILRLTAVQNLLKK